MKNQKSIIQYVYAAALLLLGVIIWGFFQTRNAGLPALSVALDTEVNDAIASCGVKNGDIESQFRRQNGSGQASWIESHREIWLRGKTNPSEIKEKMRALAAKRGCSLSITGSENAKETIRLFYGKKLLSEILLLSPGKSSGKPEKRKRIAVVIDDVGYKENLAPYLELGIPVTFAILPHERFSKKIAEGLKKRGMPFILHLPLEPERYPEVNPGKAALLIKMTDSEIREKFLSDLATVPGAAGVSNHMGSSFSADLSRMRTLLKLVKEQNLFYFDSYTSSSTKAGKVAREIGIPFGANSIFVDLEDNQQYMEKKFDTALKIINKHGQCIVIGHVQKKSLPEAMRVAVAKYRENGVEFVYLTDLIKQPKK